MFSLVDGGSATFSLAQEVARASPELPQLWKREAAAAERRRDAHWADVCSKKKELVRLRDSLQKSKADLVRKKAALQRTKTRRKTTPECTLERLSYCTCWLCDECEVASSACSTVKAEIETTEARIRVVNDIAPVLQPLPQGEDAALQVLFFMHMPAEFRSLSHLSFQARQVLLPRKWDSDSAISAAVRKPSLNGWSTYYNSHQPSRRGLDGPVALGYSGRIGEPETVVDRCTRPSDGIWHPDSLAPGCMLWRGGSFSASQRLGFCFDPFSAGILPEWTARAFTEQLPEEDQSLQWAMPQYGIGKTSPERGNLAIVNQRDAPDWLGKRQFLAFGGVRAYPLAQQRKLVLVLQDRSLPLGRPAVRSLTCQALYQIGELSSAAPTTLLWRHDQEEVFAALADELQVRVTLGTVPMKHAKHILCHACSRT